MKRRGRTPPRARQAASPRRVRGDYNFDYAGTTGEQDQNEYGDDQYGGGREGRGPFEQSQRYGARGFDSRTGAYGSLQRQFENRYTSGGYTGLKTSGRALTEPPDTDRAPSRSARLPRTRSASSREPVPSRAAGSTASRAPRAASGIRRSAANATGSPVKAAPRRGASTRSSSAKAAPRRGASARSSPAKPAPRRSASAEQRSDQRIQQDICERLAQPFERFDASDLLIEHLDASDVTVTVDGGKVTLDGTVPERRMKHYIEDLVDACPGVQDIDNRIRVPR